jgi:hypothetical protein
LDQVEQSAGKEEMTENDIKGNVSAIRHLSEQVAGADLSDPEREVVKTLVLCGLCLLEGLLLDINRGADSLDSIAGSLANLQRQQ